MEINKIELALYIIELKIANEIKNNKIKDFESFKRHIDELKQEKKEVYNENEEVINKILTVYKEDVK